MNWLPDIGVKPYFADEDTAIFHNDCRDILPLLSPKSVDLVLADPPYGIGYSATKQGYRGAKEFDAIKGDASLEMVSWILQQSHRFPLVIIWGANNFPQLLPFPGVWICWDKRVVDEADATFGWPFELAWISRQRGKGHLYRIQHGGAVNADGVGQSRFHPTQKPVSLFKRIMLDFAGGLVLDPFMGSGTSLIAAQSLGRKSIGIEVEERYCEVAVKRLQQKPLVFPKTERVVTQRKFWNEKSPTKR